MGRRALPYNRTRRWFPVIGLRLILALVPSFLAASGALEIRIVAATAGALMATSGAALIRVGWSDRRRPDLQHLSS